VSISIYNFEHNSFDGITLSSNVSLCFPVLFVPEIINPLKTKRICFIHGLIAYRAVNTLHFGYKNQSVNVL
jgi:hypothetical protein